MPKKHGVTNNLPRKRRELKREYLGFRNFKVEKRFPNQEEAKKWGGGKLNTNPEELETRGPFYGYSYHYRQKRDSAPKKA